MTAVATEAKTMDSGTVVSSGTDKEASRIGEPNEKSSDEKTSSGLQKAIQSKLDEVHYHSNEAFLSSLPASVKRRIKALKKLQSEYFTTETKFFAELHVLECKYELLYAPMHGKRCDIVNAHLEPTDAECDWASDEEEESRGEEDAKKDDKTGAESKSEKPVDKPATDAVIQIEKPSLDVPAAAPPTVDDDVRGIPDFWLQIFTHADMLAELLEDHDKPILKHLIDLRLIVDVNEPALFKLEFIFSPNDYFTNTILTKEYYLKYELDTKNPLTYDGPKIEKCKGCKIDWKEGKNVTRKTVTKTQRHKTKGTTKTVSKVVNTDSFFNFFSPPEVLDTAEPDEETEEILSNDFDVGHFLRDQIIPRAVLFFTGEALVDDDDDDDDASSGTESDKDTDA